MGVARAIRSETIEGDWQEKPAAWVWCLHCERCYQVGAAVAGDCPYPDCNGSLFFDGWEYARLQRQAHPEWPRVPVLGVVYSLY